MVDSKETVTDTKGEPATSSLEPATSSSRTSTVPILDDTQTKLIEDKIKGELNTYHIQYLEQLKESQAKSIEILGIFVAFFTFASSIFTLAKDFDFEHFIFFSPFFAGILILFILVIQISLNREKINWPLVAIVFLLLALYFASGFYSGFLINPLEDSLAHPYVKNEKGNHL